MVKISRGNAKMGAIPSVSLPAGLTCRQDCECQKMCYAKKLCRFRKTVKESYETNYKILKEDPDTYWREIEASIMMSRFFRFHVSGDIPDLEYFQKMVEVARRNRHCQILVFTKQYEIVNCYFEQAYSGVMDTIPENLHVVYSGWRGLTMDNPFRFPEAHVRYRDGTTTADEEIAKECGGNCTECGVSNDGCWSLRRGEQIVFKEH